MITSKVSRLKKVILGILLVIIITVSIMLIDSLRSTQTIENQAASPIAGQCLMADKFCEWEIDGDATDLIFHYQIVDTSGTENLIAAEGDTSDGFVAFSPITNHAYKCVVNVKNNCDVSSKNVESPISTCKAGGAQTTAPTSMESISPTQEKPSPTIDPKSKVIKIIQTKAAISITATPSSEIATPTANTIQTPIPQNSPTPIIKKISPEPTTPLLPIATDKLPEAGVAEYLPMIVLFGFGIILVGFLI